MNLELAKKLREACDKYIHGSVSLEVTESNLVENIENLEKEQTKLQGKIAELNQLTAEAEKRMGNIDKQIREETKSKRDAIERDEKEASLLIEQLREKQAVADDKKREYEFAETAAEKARIESESKAKEYKNLIAEVKAKKAKLDKLFSDE